MAHRMTDAEVCAFLDRQTVTAVVATTAADGSPHAAPVWFALDDDGMIVFNTGEGSVKGRNLRRDPRVALSVADDRPPYAFVIIRGVAELIDDLAEVRRWATAIGGRYMGPDQAEAFGERNGVPGELLVRVHPERIAARADLTG